MEAAVSVDDTFHQFQYEVRRISFPFIIFPNDNPKKEQILDVQECNSLFKKGSCARNDNVIFTERPANKDIYILVHCK